MAHEKYTPEQEVALRYIEKVMSFWEITPADLRRAPAATKRPPAPLKYRHPRSGEEWDGTGKQPQWLRDALLKEGMTVDELKPRNLPNVSQSDPAA
ncbi:hypothetical protein BH09PSE5_BH09PSE5_20740 [soil metagenome]